MTKQRNYGPLPGTIRYDDSIDCHLLDWVLVIILGLAGLLLIVKSL